MAKRLLVAALGLCVLLVLGPGVFLTAWRNTIVVRNSSDTPLSTVSLKVQNLAGTWSQTLTTAQLHPGQSLVCRLGHNDSRATLQFSSGNTAHEFTEPLINLRRGRTWVFDVRPDSSVISRSDANHDGA
jgi:hypothetical protein